MARKRAPNTLRASYRVETLCALPVLCAFTCLVLFFPRKPSRAILSAPTLPAFFASRAGAARAGDPARARRDAARLDQGRRRARGDETTAV
eukprot:5567878-Pleurochrysis_carterae.AAC.3